MPLTSPTSSAVPGITFLADALRSAVPPKSHRITCLPKCLNLGHRQAGAAGLVHHPLGVVLQSAFIAFTAARIPRMHPRVRLQWGSGMKMLIPFPVPVALGCILLSHAPRLRLAASPASSRAHIENIGRKSLGAAPMGHADVEWPTPLAMRGNHFAALGEFLAPSQPWPELKAGFLLQRLRAES